MFINDMSLLDDRVDIVCENGSFYDCYESIFIYEYGSNSDHNTEGRISVNT